MAQQQYGVALDEVNNMCRGKDDVVCLLEEGLLLHYTGQYDSSNKVFDRAEVRTEDLYTKSISRQAASLVTSDLALEYVPRPFEQALINYFRALNYMFLADEEGALVECRKASEKLARYSEDGGRPYRQDAFLEYLTGILYEWGGETNDAFISYRNATEAYATYRDRFGIPAPPELACDIVRTAEAMGFADEAEMVPVEDRARCAGDSGVAVSDLAKIVVFIEQGFVPAMQEVSLQMPILKSEAEQARGDPHNFSAGISSRVYGGYTYDASDVEYYLRVALPSYADPPVGEHAPRLYLNSRECVPAKCEDVFAIARTELNHDLPKIFAKTIARAIIKHKATEEAKKAGGKHGWLTGGLVNIFTAATEQADLRSWLSLPRAIYVATLYVAPGTHTIMLAGSPNIPAAAAASATGCAQSGGQEIQLDTKAGATSFVRFRTYR